jgi:hypothetical protein
MAKGRSALRWHATEGVVEGAVDGDEIWSVWAWIAWAHGERLLGLGTGTKVLQAFLTGKENKPPKVKLFSAAFLWPPKIILLSMASP